MKYRLVTWYNNQPDLVRDYGNTEVQWRIRLTANHPQ